MLVWLKMIAPPNWSRFKTFWWVSLFCFAVKPSFVFVKSNCWFKSGRKIIWNPTPSIKHSKNIWHHLKSSKTIYCVYIYIQYIQYKLIPNPSKSHWTSAVKNPIARPSAKRWRRGVAETWPWNCWPVWLKTGHGLKSTIHSPFLDGETVKL